MDDLRDVFSELRMTVFALHSVRDRFYNEDALRLLDLKVEVMGAAGMLDLILQRVENLIDQGQRLTARRSSSVAQSSTEAATPSPLQGPFNFLIGDPCQN